MGELWDFGQHQVFLPAESEDGLLRQLRQVSLAEYQARPIRLTAGGAPRQLRHRLHRDPLDTMRRLVNQHAARQAVLACSTSLPPRKGDTVRAKLSRRMPLSTGRRQFLTVKLVGDEAVPVFKESGAITSIAEADGYIELAENIDLMEKGDAVNVVLF